MKKTIEVVAGIIRNENDVLCTQRGPGKNMAVVGLYEFPGGKIEAGETHEQALKRELIEELELEVEVGNFYHTLKYEYPDFHLIMHCYECTTNTKEMKLHVHLDNKWLPASRFDELAWVPADIELVEKLKMDKKYI